jgi:hypothetical protein
LGYELLIRARPGQPPLPEPELRAWLERAQREGIRAGVWQPPTEAPPLEAPRQAPAPPAAASEGAASSAQPGKSERLARTQSEHLAGMQSAEPSASAQSGEQLASTTSGEPSASAQNKQAPSAEGTGAAPGAPPEAQSAPTAWELANGRGALRARLYRGEGGLGGADLEVPFGGAEEELRAAVDFALNGAAQVGATVFDPQLAREVGRESTEDIVERWRLSQRWAVDVAGTAEDSRSTLAFTPAPPLFQVRHKVALGILIGLGLLYKALGLVVDAMR